MSTDTPSDAASLTLLDDDHFYDTGTDPSSSQDSNSDEPQIANNQFVNGRWTVIDPDAAPEYWWIPSPEVLEEKDARYLCRYCRHVDFLAVLRGVGGPDAERVPLRSLNEALLQKECSFCRLVIAGIIDHGEWNLHDSELTGQAILSLGTWQAYSMVRHLDVLAIRRDGGLRYASERQQFSIRFGIHSFGESPRQGRAVSLDQIDAGMLRSWLECCENHHPAPSFETSQLPSLAVVDVHRQCIVRLHQRERYAALSYVWGLIQHDQYTKVSRKAFEKEGGLSHVRIPQTVRDAITLTSKLGLQYLWVDSLCIIQDDYVEKARLIEAMGSIYNASALTIIAAHGEHADTGLCGISRPRIMAQHTEIVQGSCFALRLTDRLLHTKWNTRGWTYQELMLSRRKLYVTKEQVEFVCDHIRYYEEEVNYPSNDSCCLEDKEQAGLGSPSLSYFAGMSFGFGCQPLIKRSLWELYMISVERYTSRQLTNQNDIISAFHGLADRLRAATPCRYLFNLPENGLDEALLWNPAERPGISVRDPVAARHNFRAKYWSIESRRGTPGIDIPTWSWASWNGAVKYGYRLGLAYRPIRSVLIWLANPVGNQEGFKNTVHITRQDFRCRDWQGAGWKRETVYQEDSEAVSYYSHPDRKDVWFHRPIALTEGQRSSLRLMDNNNRLHFMAFSAALCYAGQEPDHGFSRLRIAKEDALGTTPISNSASMLRHIYDSKGFQAGEVVLNAPVDEKAVHENRLGLIALSQGLTRPAKKESRFDELFIDRQSPEEQKDFTVFEDAEPEKLSVELSWEEVIDGWPCPRWNPARFPDRIFGLYNVLLVEWRDDIAYRIGVGQVQYDAFHSGGAQWRKVNLG